MHRVLSGYNDVRKKLLEKPFIYTYNFRINRLLLLFYFRGRRKTKSNFKYVLTILRAQFNSF